MADPISIIGLLTTVASLTKTVMDYASAVKDAPKELENLSRELATLHDIFEHLIEFLKSDDSKEDFVEVSALYNAAGVRLVPCVFLYQADLLILQASRIW